MKGHISAPLSALLGSPVVLDTTSYLSPLPLSVLGAIWCDNTIHPQMIVMVFNLYFKSLAPLVCHRQSPLNA
ncbi:hypothetical protein L1887_01332 [Cichorium endivia]|nr:hypothetical protein L1887_01332 [Cichorium endivia]